MVGGNSTHPSSLSETDIQKLTEIFLELDELISRSEGIAVTFETISSQLGALLQFDRASVLIKTHDDDKLTIYAIDRQESAFNLGSGKQVPKSPEFQKVESTGFGIINRDLPNTKDSVPAALLYSHGVRTFIMAPLFVNNVMIGTLNIGSKNQNQYGERELALLTFYANHIAPTIDNSLLQSSIKSSEKKYRELADFLPATLFELNHRGKITYANQQALNLFGYTMDELKSAENTLPLIHQETRDRAQYWFNNLIKGNTYQQSDEFIALRKNGDEFPALVYAAPIYHDDTIVGVRGFIIDLTEQKAMERALQTQWENFREIFTHMPNGFFRKSSDGTFQLVNPQFANLLGYDYPDELIGRKIQNLPNFIFHRRDEFTAAMEEHGKVDNFRTVWQTNDGKDITVRIRARARYDENDKEMYYEGTVEDITDQLTVEKQLIQAQKMEALGEIGSGIAHDFNNVLATISGACQLIGQQLTNTEMKKYIKMAKASIQRGQSITSRLTAFARSEDPTVTTIALNQFIEEIREIAQLTLPKHILIHTTPIQQVDTVAVDQTQLQQVVLNLCMNAADAMPDGGNITLHVFRPDHAEIQQYDVDHTKKYVCLAVEDTGTGIGEADRTEIFKPFFTTKPRGKGTGLGLAVAYRIIRDHDGWIDVSSKLGEGSRFIIGLPHVAAKSNPSQENPSVQHQSSKNCGRILIVENQPCVLEILGDMLRADGHRVEKILTGQEALQIFHSNGHPFDVVLLDLDLPAMDGKLLAKKIRSLHNNLPLIAITGHLRGVNMEKLKQYGFHDVIQRPNDLDRVSSVVMQVI